MAREKKEQHPNFLNYKKMIVTHKNYKDFPYDFSKDDISWVVTGKSTKGLLRRKWWDKQCNKYSIPIEKGCYAIIARLIHPTGVHVCQSCGEEQSIFYEYPTKNTLKKINKFNKKTTYNYGDYTIREIIEENRFDMLFLQNIANIFNLNFSYDSMLIKDIYDFHVKNESRLLSPGVMSNSPDRLDGFHSFCLKCRPDEDKGRHKENLSKYGEDRRAYENWSYGNWKHASWVMKEINKIEDICPICGNYRKMSADHIGPISLGFSHTPFFEMICSSCNSSKNNRMSYEDIQKLLELEKKAVKVISPHSEYLWDLLKFNIKNNDDSITFSNIMKENLLNILNLFYIISKAGHNIFLLKFLHPEYAFYTYNFDNYNISEIINGKCDYSYINRTENINNAIRSIRIAFDSLYEYAKQDNRKIKHLLEELSGDIVYLLSILDSAYTQKSPEDLIKDIEENLKKHCDTENEMLNYFKYYEYHPEILGYENKAFEVLEEIIIKIGKLILEKDSF